MNKNCNNTRKINPAYNDYNNNDSFNGGYNIMNKRGSSLHEDIPIKMPVRLNKTLVKVVT